MTHDRHTNTINSSIYDIQFTLGALEGIEVLMNPDGDLNARGRDKVALLLGLVIETANRQMNEVYEQIKQIRTPVTTNASAIVSEDDFICDSLEYAEMNKTRHAHILKVIRNALKGGVDVNFFKEKTYDYRSGPLKSVAKKAIAYDISAKGFKVLLQRSQLIGSEGADKLDTISSVISGKKTAAEMVAEWRASQK